MSFFSQFFNTLHLNNTKPNKTLQKNNDQCLKNLTYSDISSQYSGYSDGNSEADINTSRMVKIMTGFHNNNNNNNNSCSINREGGNNYFQLKKNYKTKSDKEKWSKNSSDIDCIKKDTVHEAKNVLEKNKNNNNKRKKRNGITRRQKRHIHDNLWSKARD